MINVTPTFLPSCVLVPQAVASMVSFLSRENPGTLPNISRLVKSGMLNTTLQRPDFANIFFSSSLLLCRDYFGIQFVIVRLQFGDDNYTNYLSFGQKHPILATILLVVTGPDCPVAPNEPPLRARGSRP